MRYLAHKDGEREQSILEHLTGTAELAGDFADKFGNADWGYCCGMLHDIGKYSAPFQSKIRENSNRKIDHATAGAKVCENLGGMYSIMSYCIAGHHAGLPDYGNAGIASSLAGRLQKKVFEYTDYQQEIKIPELKSKPFESLPSRGEWIEICFAYLSSAFFPSLPSRGEWIEIICVEQSVVSQGLTCL